MCRPILRFLLAFFSLLVGVHAKAQVPMPVYVVPVVVKAPGASGTNWSTDLFITNLGTRQAKVSAHDFVSGQPNTFNGIFAKPDVTLAAPAGSRDTACWRES